VQASPGLRLLPGPLLRLLQLTLLTGAR
jgi:hypothetical protein